jgi:hypothetical protein
LWSWLLLVTRLLLGLIAWLLNRSLVADWKVFSAFYFAFGVAALIGGRSGKEIAENNYHQYAYAKIPG